MGRATKFAWPRSASALTRVSRKRVTSLPMAPVNWRPEAADAAVVPASEVRLPKVSGELLLPPPICRSTCRVCRRQSTPRLSRSSWLISMIVTSISTSRGFTSSDSIKRRYWAMWSGVSRTSTALSRVSAWNCGSWPLPQVLPCTSAAIMPLPPMLSSTWPGSAEGMLMPPLSPVRSLAMRVAPRLVPRLGFEFASEPRLRP
ncbi:hypothetical protein D3C72_1146650 [compost metagenome]